MTGHQLAHILKAKGQTQPSAATLLRVAPHTLRNWLAGRRSISELTELAIHLTLDQLPNVHKVETTQMAFSFRSQRKHKTTKTPEIRPSTMPQDASRDFPPTQMTS
jgi:transcriptional regulator with XRE-family HTH domain